MFYGITIWGNCNNLDNIKSLQALHCRAARLIYNLPWDTPSKTGMEVTNWDSIYDMCKINLVKFRKEAWPSGLRRWICNREFPGANPPPYCYLDLFTVVPSSTPRPRCVNSQLVSLSLILEVLSYVIIFFFFLR